MVLGLNTEGEKTKKKSKKADTSSKKSDDTDVDEAAELLKEVEAKKAAGDCPFC